jgi:hypothetical protein
MQNFAHEPGVDLKKDIRPRMQLRVDFILIKDIHSPWRLAVHKQIIAEHCMPPNAECLILIASSDVPDSKNFLVQVRNDFNSL